MWTYVCLYHLLRIQPYMSAMSMCMICMHDIAFTYSLTASKNISDMFDPVHCWFIIFLFAESMGSPLSIKEKKKL
jgi:hypothetical protein